MQKRKLKTWQEVLVALLFVVPLMLFLFWPMLSSEVPPWETGRDVPAESPDESRRVHSELGISIIVPPNWTHRDMPERNQIGFYPRQSFPRRHRAGISVRRMNADSMTVHAQATAEAKTVETELAGYDARLTTLQRAGSFDDPPLKTWMFLVSAGDETYEVSYFLADDPDELPPMVRRYLETFRVEAGGRTSSL
ncbi:hypothetical protein Mal4_40960 [Maioricimonas rarisocia]|uniref:Uncharacterized protein n=1 Tax=Maioricimonas rarisocia TaxID=2528026 RepID=A0A517ZBE0_9PLAN|nr:hypothetical protein [Maioricimonas rarisocia]QDU39749.1 hypothetical protein Mal4_40960 [Maioricimonas rarisocia]